MSGKAVASMAFDAARKQLRGVMQKTKRIAHPINEPADLWELEHYLTQRRKKIDRK